MAFAARSPMITQGAIVLPVVTRGIIDPSVIRRFSIPYTFRFASTTDRESRPILAVQVWCHRLTAVFRRYLSSAKPLTFPGTSSCFKKGRSVAELPISRQSSTTATRAFRSSGSDKRLLSMSSGSRGSGPARRTRPRLLVRMTSRLHHPTARR